ncbi:MAG: methylase [Subtercola sp.]|nr:methylase [Subtercola sp.]
MTAIRNSIRIGDAAETLKTMRSSSVDMVLTSPPYFRLRDYGTDGQLGLEATVEEWVDGLVAVVDELSRVLTSRGTLWLNVGDTYSTRSDQGAQKKSLLMAPERLALALLKRGWILRNKIVWAKPNGMPTSATDRLATKWEAVYVFSRSKRYHFDLDAIRQPHLTRPPKAKAETRPPTREPWQGPNGDSASGLAAMKASGRVGHVLGKNPGDVWSIPTSVWRGAHHAVFPVALAERAITAGCPQRICGECRAPYIRRIKRLGAVAVKSKFMTACECSDGSSTPGVVLDPFMGAGTTAIAAERLGRDWLGVELNPEFAALAVSRIRADRIKRTTKGGVE